MIASNDQIRDLQAENDALATKVKFKAENTTYENGECYEVFDNGQIADLPFCQHCMTDGQFIRLAYAAIDVSKSHCPGCKTFYNTTTIIRKAERPAGL